MKLLLCYKPTKIYIWQFTKEKINILIWFGFICTQVSPTDWWPENIWQIWLIEHQSFTRQGIWEIFVHVWYIYLEQFSIYLLKRQKLKQKYNWFLQWCPEVSSSSGAGRQTSKGMARRRGGGVTITAIRYHCTIG